LRKKHLYAVALLLLIPVFCFSQTWKKTYTGDMKFEDVYDHVMRYLDEMVKENSGKNHYVTATLEALLVDDTSTAYEEPSYEIERKDNTLIFRQIYFDDYSGWVDIILFTERYTLAAASSQASYDFNSDDEIEHLWDYLDELSETAWDWLDYEADYGEKKIFQ
jgi:hypothetical protein